MYCRACKSRWPGRDSVCADHEPRCAGHGGRSQTPEQRRTGHRGQNPGHRRRPRRYQAAEEGRHPTLGTAVYSASQGLLAALAGAKYVAPYVNRVDAQGGDGIRMVQELQSLLEMHAPESKVLAASFKTPRQALDCLLAGCEAITLPLDVAQQMLGTLR